MTHKVIAVIVRKPKVPVSITFLNVVVIYLFLMKDVYVLTVINREPRIPPRMPRTKAPQMCSRGTEMS